MARDFPSEVEALEAQVAAEPESESVRDDLLLAFCGHPELHGHFRRIDHIRDFVRRFPRSSTCRSPAVAVDPAVSPDGFRVIEQEWSRLLSENPDDADIVCGAALFIARSDPGRAADLLRRESQRNPECAGVWLEMGRISPDPGERLDCLRKAHSLGAENPNLIIWIGRAALAVHDFAAAEIAARRLLDHVKAARSTYGDRLDWPERGRDLWERARSSSPDRATATQLVRAIGEHAHRKHWGHTIMGLVAVHEGDLSAAAGHLRQSGDVVGDPRLSSYGPTLSLASVLCEHGLWEDVAAYLQACATFWEDDRLEAWRAQVGGKVE